MSWIPLLSCALLFIYMQPNVFLGVCFLYLCLEELHCCKATPSLEDGKMVCDLSYNLNETLGNPTPSSIPIALLHLVQEPLRCNNGKAQLSRFTHAGPN